MVAFLVLLLRAREAPVLAPFLVLVLVLVPALFLVLAQVRVVLAPSPPEAGLRKESPKHGPDLAKEVASTYGPDFWSFLSSNEGPDLALFVVCS